MKMNFIKLSTVAVLAMTPFSAFGATGNIPFNGNVQGACVINVGSNGVMAASSDLQTFGSTQAGGSAGTASILSNGGGFNLSVDPVTSFDSEPTGDVSSAETFTPSYSATGATTASAGTTTATAVNAGNTSISVDLDAVKGGSDVFAAGNYTATVVLRCE